MKKIILIIIMFLFVPNIKALGLVREERIEGVYANQIVGGTRYSAKFSYIYVNNEASYCIEPGVMLSSSNYQETTDFDKFNISSEDRHYLELVSYYGYNYPNHQNKYYYMATQELIWRRITSDDVIFTTGPWFSGEVINIESYKNEILNLISKHNTKPSFDGMNLVEKDSRIILTDQNKVLNNFVVSKGNAQIKDNTLIINSIENIELVRMFNGTSYIYTSPGSQRIINLKLKDKIVSNLTLTKKVDNYKLKLIKKDLDTKETIGEAIFKIKDLSTNNYIKINNSELLKTNNGILYIDNLEEGYYVIEEVEAPDGYFINSEPIKINIIQDQVEQIVYNKKITMPKTGYQVNKKSVVLSLVLTLSMRKIKKHVK